ncbi:MAG: hypothetical protein J6A15_01970 [Clostridia bacterium]|nr:hypothetical protein [Clostridia bacterium]
MKIKIKILEQNESETQIENKGYVAIYILGIRVKKIIIDRKFHSGNSSNKNLDTIYMLVKQIVRSLENKEILEIINTLLKSIKIHKLDLNLGINLEDPIINAYSIALINSILPMIIMYNDKKVNLKNISYNTFISNKVIYLDVKSVAYVSIFKNLKSIFKLIFKVKTKK